MTTSKTLVACAIFLIGIAALMSFRFSPTFVSLMIFIAVVLLAVSQLLEPENYKESSPDYCTVKVSDTCVCMDYPCKGKPGECAEPPECFNECSEDKDCPNVNGHQYKCNSETGPGPDGGYISWLTCEPPLPPISK